MPNLTTKPPEFPRSEPHVLSILRWTMSIGCFLYFWGMLGALNTPDKLPNDYGNIFFWLLCTGLVVYLFVPIFRRRLRQRFIPFLLVAISIGPIVIVYAANWLYRREETAVSSEFLHVGQLFVWIIIALLLVSTHYNIKAILIFVGSTSILAMLLAVWQQQILGIAIAPALQGVAGWLTVFLFTGYFVHQLTKSIRQQQIALSEQNEQLADYALTVEQLTVTQERNRLARELHDTLAHTLSAVEMQLKALDILIQRDPDAARQHLAQTRTVTRDGLQAARRALHDLRVQPVAEFGLLLALERLVQQTAQRTGAEPGIILPQQLRGVPSHIEHHLYRIAEEALNNMGRHANAAQFWLELEAKPSHIQMTIRDDGVGFDLESLPNGRYGLQGIQERAELIQASLTINSAPGQGSVINIAWEQT